MRCLFFIEDYPITPDSPGGAPALSYSHLELLAYTGAELHLVMLANPRRSLGFAKFTASQPQVWEQVRSWCASHRVIEIAHAPTPRAPVRHFLQALRDPVPYICADAQPQVLNEFKDIVAQLQPDLIWAEHRVPAMLARRAATGTPIVYSHHDWEWLLGQQRFEGQQDTLSRAQRLRRRFGIWQTKRAECATVSGVAACVSGSITETAEFKTLGARHAAYLPTTYEPVSLLARYDDAEPVRVVHLGGMQGTRNQTSVQRFLDLAWGPSCAEHPAAPQLWQVGSMKGASDEILAALQQAQAVCTGFVPDLGEVLRPGDIHVVPWEWPTGTRTRIPVALNHGQALVSTRAAAVCLPELKDGENCLLAADLPELGQAIGALLNDPARRRQLAAAGRATFLQHYTRPALQPRFQQFLSELGVSLVRSAPAAIHLQPST
jgi:hypothetical protein